MEDRTSQTGLTKRQHFAALAMQGMLANPSLYQGGYTIGDMCDIGEKAWQFADAVLDREHLAELERTGSLPVELNRFIEVMPGESFPDVDEAKFENAYAARNARLKILGYESYQQYLESDLWRSIRNMVLQRDRHCCRLCWNHRAAQQVHHRRYDMRTLRGVDASWLVAICLECHDRIEFRDGIKNSVEETEATLRTNCNFSDGSVALVDDPFDGIKE